MNWTKLLSIGALTMFSASIATGQGTAPTIVQGDYISNVFGNSNFIKNPNAKLNNKDVTVSNATVTRSTTTPLVATSEFLVTTSTATGSATWSTRTFDSGMKGQNCEARFTYRGFSVGSTTAQILQGANVVAQLTLTPSTDPRIASINFPCGDLSSVTTFRLQQATASLTGTNEIGGIYIGLATNMANVAQAEFYGSLIHSGNANCIWLGNGASAIAADNDCTTYQEQGNIIKPSTNVPAIQFTPVKSGNYKIAVSAKVGEGANNDAACAVYENGSLVSSLASTYTVGVNSAEIRQSIEFNRSITSGTAYTYDVRCVSGDTILARDGYEYLQWTVYRFPSSSELVVTPERQGDWWISGIFTGGLPLLGTTTAMNFVYSEITNSTLSFIPDSGSQPVATVCSATNAPPALSTSATTCAAGNESLGLTFNVPSVGSYEVCTEFSQSVAIGANGSIDSTFSLQETAVNNNTALTSKSGLNGGHGYNTAFEVFTNIPYKLCETFNFTSIGQKAVRLMYAYNHIAPINQNQIIANDSQGKRNIKFTVQQVTGKSNSALYVEGPVKASATGAAIPASYVGEEKIAYATNTSTVNNDTEVDVTGASITLDPGVWELQYSSTVLVERTPASTSGVYCRLRIRDSANNAEASTESTTGLYSSTNDASWNFFEMSKNKRINLTSTKTFKLSITSSVSSSVAVCIAQTGNLTGGITGNEATTYIRAVRLN